MGGILGMRHVLSNAGTIKDFMESTDNAELLEELEGLIADEVRVLMLEVLSELGK